MYYRYWWKSLHTIIYNCIRLVWRELPTYRQLKCLLPNRYVKKHILWKTLADTVFDYTILQFEIVTRPFASNLLAFKSRTSCPAIQLCLLRDAFCIFPFHNTLTLFQGRIQKFYRSIGLGSLSKVAMVGIAEMMPSSKIQGRLNLLGLLLHPTLLFYTFEIALPVDCQVFIL